MEPSMAESVSAIMQSKGAAYTVGFLQGHLEAAIAELPKNQQKMFCASFNRSVWQVVDVEVGYYFDGLPEKSVRCEAS